MGFDIKKTETPRTGAAPRHPGRSVRTYGTGSYDRHGETVSWERRAALERLVKMLPSDPANSKHKAVRSQDPPLLAGSEVRHGDTFERSRRAKIIGMPELKRVLKYISQRSKQPEADTCVFTLAHLAGLRACEIAGLHVSAVTTSNGKIASEIWVTPKTGKGGKGRYVPMHPIIEAAIRTFRNRHPNAQYFAISPFPPYEPRSSNTLRVYMARIYKECGLEGCSSHSGRRSCITMMARNIHKTGGSLRDVQMFAGHARLDSTERYIEPSKHLVDMVRLLGTFSVKGAR